MSLLGKLLSQARKEEIGYGIHENCVILAISNDIRKNKDSLVIPRNCYTKIGQLNENNEITHEKEISWFNLDPTSEWVYENLMSQLEQMSAIVDTLRDPSTDGKDIWDMAFEAILTDEKVELNIEAFKAALKVKKTCDNILKALGDTYTELLEPLVGPDSLKLRFKVVYDNNGKYLQQPKYGAFVESMDKPAEDFILKITKNDEESKAKSLSLSTAKPKVTNI